MRPLVAEPPRGTPSRHPSLAPAAAAAPPPGSPSLRRSSARAAVRRRSFSGLGPTNVGGSATWARCRSASVGEEADAGAELFDAGADAALRLHERLAQLARERRRRARGAADADFRPALGAISGGGGRAPPGALETAAVRAADAEEMDVLFAKMEGAKGKLAALENMYG